MATCLIGLGANLGDPRANLAAAVTLLAEFPQVTGVRVSHGHPSQAVVGGGSQSEYLNAAATFETTLQPADVLKALQQIERQLGRRRGGDRWAAREIDLDLLFYDDLVMDAPGLMLPHPRLAYRRFVLEPATELVPNFVHPANRFSLQELLTQIDRRPRRIVITGATQSALQLARLAAANSDMAVLDEPQDAPRSLELSGRGGPSCQTAIELVRQRRDEVRRLRQRSSPTGSVPPTEVCSGWIGEYLAAAKLQLPSDAFHEFERTWMDEPDADELDRATLIVILVDPEEDKPATSRSPQTLPAEIKRLATRPRQAPWLLLNATDLEWALREVLAAIEAMQ